MTEFADETDRRLHPRVQIPGKVRATTDQGVIDATVGDISAGGVALLADALLEKGRELSLEIDGLTLLDGRVTRSLDDGFVVSLELSADDEDRFLAEVMQIQNGIDPEDL